MSPDKGCRVPAPPNQRPRGQRRGRAALKHLASTDDFSPRARIRPEARNLVLFLLVVLTDDDGCLTRTYEAVLASYSTVPGHWAYGRDLAGLRRLVSKFLGSSAARIPPWDRIVDLVRVAIPEPDQSWVLALAAGLFCRATGQDRPPGDYSGQILAPSWTRANVLTVADVRAQLSAGAASTGEHDATGQDATVSSSTPSTDVGDPANQRLLLDATIRAYRVLDAQLQQVKTQLEQARKDNARLREWLAENPALHDQIRAPRRGNRQLDGQHPRPSGVTPLRVANGPTTTGDF